MALHSCSVGLHVEWDRERGNHMIEEVLQWDLEGLDKHHGQATSIVVTQRIVATVANPFRKD